jgi:hypothetical protein
MHRLTAHCGPLHCFPHLRAARCRCTPDVPLSRSDAQNRSHLRIISERPLRFAEQLLSGVRSDRECVDKSNLLVASTDPDRKECICICHACTCGFQDSAWSRLCTAGTIGAYWMDGRKGQSIRGANDADCEPLISMEFLLNIIAYILVPSPSSIGVF